MKTELCKEICKKCSEEKLYWNGRDERSWKYGYIVCPEGWEYVRLEEGIPDECPYTLEHIVMGNQD